jgi:hypothetical protein
MLGMLPFVPSVLQLSKLHEPPKAIVSAFGFLAKQQHLIEMPPEAMFEACERYLISSDLPFSLLNPGEDVSTMGAIEAILDNNRDRKRRREAAPSEVGGGSGGGASGAGGSVPKAMLADLEKVLGTKNFVEQETSLIAHFSKLGVEGGYDRASLLQRMLIGKTPPCLLPSEPILRAALIQRESARTPIALFHQILARKYAAANVVPSLSLLDQVCKEATLAELLWRVAVSAYWTSSDPMPACLASGELRELAQAIMKEDWGKDIDLVKMLDAKVLAAFHRCELNVMSSGNWKTDVLQLWRIAHPAQKVFELFTFSDVTAGKNVGSALRAPLSYSRLHIATSLEGRGV